MHVAQSAIMHVSQTTDCSHYLPYDISDRHSLGHITKSLKTAKTIPLSQSSSDLFLF